MKEKERERSEWLLLLCEGFMYPCLPSHRLLYHHLPFPPTRSYTVDPKHVKAAASEVSIVPMGDFLRGNSSKGGVGGGRALAGAGGAAPSAASSASAAVAAPVAAAAAAESFTPTSSEETNAVPLRGSTAEVEK